jgi:hypothetical protein
MMTPLTWDSRLRSTQNQPRTGWYGSQDVGTSDPVAVRARVLRLLHRDRLREIPRLVDV